MARIDRIEFPPKRLKIYSDLSFLPPNRNHSELLIPFFGPIDDGVTSWGRTKFDLWDAWQCLGREAFEMVPLINADFAVLPFDYESEYFEHAKSFVELAAASGKKTIVIFKGDESEDIALENIIVFRHSTYSIGKPPGVYTLPAWSEDFVARYLNFQLPIRKWSEQPVVGFCGQKIKEQSHPRNVALDFLQADRRLQANFRILEGYQAGLTPSSPVEEHLKARLDFVDNMRSCDYAFCSRGAGNYSYRLFEALSMGRIPLFLDTFCVLPFNSIISWKDHLVWVDIYDIQHIGQRLLDFNSSIGQKNFRQMQIENRRLWERYLNPLGFYFKLHEFLTDSQPS